jgi:hypothetical protein
VIEQGELLPLPEGVAPLAFTPVHVRAHKRLIRARSTDPLNMQAAHERADDGMKRAAEHAEDVRANWLTFAREELVTWLRTQRGPFLAEDFVIGTHNSLPPPPDRRAFGLVIQSAARAGIIVKVGYALAATSNGSPKCRWQDASTL